MFCNHCGVAMPANAVSCENCGHRVIGDISAMEAKIKPPAGKRNDTFATIRTTTIVLIIWWLLSIAIHPGWHPGYCVLAAMVLVGVEWCFWRKAKRLK